MTPTVRQRVTVYAPARLHLGFLDLNGSLGRRYGSLGLALDRFALRLHAYPDVSVGASGPQAERAAACARRALDHLGIEAGVQVVVEQAIPDHAGLGSGTQLALAVGSAVAHLYGVAWPPRRMARVLRRGERSGIGLALYEQGGFVVDGGRGADAAPPAVLARLDFPAAWRLLLVFDPGGKGLHGDRERQAFATLPPFPEATADRLCRLALMQAMPGLVEQDVGAFGAAIGAIQEAVGDHFAPAQGGRYASPAVAEALAWLRGRGAAGVGQSSWGPTGFAILDSEFAAQSMARQARAEFAGLGLEFRVCSGRNEGAELQVEDSGLRRRAG